MHTRALALAAVAALAPAVGCGKAPQADTAVGRADVVSNNMLRSDYAGSQACRGCHVEIWERWNGSPMRRMTRDVESTRIRAPLDGRRLEFMGDSAALEKHEGRPYLSITSNGGRSELYSITKVIGGRYREDFVGVEVDGTRAPAPRFGDERVLPVSYLVFDGSLRYKGYSVMSPERPELRKGARWRTTCIFCHNTVPAFSSLLDEVYGDGAPTYQGAASVELPENKRFHFEITDADELERAVLAELQSLGSDEQPSSRDPKALLDTLISATRRNFGENHLIELGVGCEACHGGAKEHVRNPTRRPSFRLESSFVQVKAPGGGAPTPAQDINRACAKCHTVLFTRYPYTWEGRTRNASPGGSHINSGEARDLLLGGCSTELHCANCHDPHGKGKSQATPERPAASLDALCAKCHTAQGAPERRAAHTHHAPGSAGTHCIECHMPRKNMGLAYDLVRYHRIGSPTDRERVEGDRPLECALCHADRSVQSLVTTMERWWKKSYNRSALHELYGTDLSVNVLEATLRRGKPHEKAVVIGVVKEQKLAARAPLVVEELDNEYPLVRFFAKSALERLLGPAPAIDWHAPGPVLVQQGRRWLGQPR
jgi:hypothetical protein